MLPSAYDWSRIRKRSSSDHRSLRIAGSLETCCSTG
jgi:hypothetical protein